MDIFKTINDGCKTIAENFYRENCIDSLIKDVLGTDEMVENITISPQRQIVFLKIYGFSFELEIPFDVFENEKYNEFVKKFIGKKKQILSDLKAHKGQIIKVSYPCDYTTYDEYILCDHIEVWNTENEEVYIEGRLLKVLSNNNKITGFNTSNRTSMTANLSNIEIIDESTFNTLKQSLKNFSNQQIDDIFKSDMFITVNELYL